MPGIEELDRMGWSVSFCGMRSNNKSRVCKVQSIWRSFDSSIRNESTQNRDFRASPRFSATIPETGVATYRRSDHEGSWATSRSFSPQLRKASGWSDAFAYVSIRDAYLPGFKIPPSVQFSARMWHVAILVTPGLCRTIYRPPSAAPTIYLPLALFLSPLRHRALSLSPCIFLPFSLASFFLWFPSRLASFFHLAHGFRIESTLVACSTWTLISQTFDLYILRYR